MKLRDLGEFGLIDLIRKRTPPGPGVRLGIGDDAAWVSTAEDSLLFTSDLLVEGVHFNLEWISMPDLGRKSLTASLSDIAAMGGRPAYFLLSLALPDVGARRAAALVRGVHALAAEHRVALVGGDTCAADHLVIDVFLAGYAPYGAVTRAGAEVGDDIYVTGTLGDSALGLSLLSEPRPKVSARDRSYLVRRHHRPTARVETGMELARQGLARAMMDVSDGLAQDLGRICRASGTGAVVRQQRVPLSPAFVRVAEPRDAACALAGGEDYELLFTAASGARKGVERVARRTGVPITRIGECVPGKRGLALVDPQGECVPLTGAGYDHFKETLNNRPVRPERGEAEIPVHPKRSDAKPPVPPERRETDSSVHPERSAAQSPVRPERSAAKSPVHPERSAAKTSVHPERSAAKPPVHPERSAAKSKDALSHRERRLQGREAAGHA